GTLSADQRAAAMERLVKDPAAMDEFASYQFTAPGGPMARVFEEVLAAPDWLVDAVRSPAPARSTNSSASGSSLLARLGALLRLPVLSPALAIPAMAVAVAAGWFASTALHYVPMEERGYVASAPLQKALEETPSGSTAAVIEGLSLKPTLTFAGLEKTWCRQV